MSLSDEIGQTAFPDPHTEAVLELHFTSHWLYRVLQEELNRFEISPEQYNILRILRGNRGEAYCLRDVQGRMLNRTANTTRLVEKLRSRGLVSRTANATDRRRVDIAITPDGAALLEAMEAPVETMNRRVRAALSERDAKSLTRILEKLRSGMQGDHHGDARE